MIAKQGVLSFSREEYPLEMDWMSGLIAISCRFVECSKLTEISTDDLY